MLLAVLLLMLAGCGGRSTSPGSQSGGQNSSVEISFYYPVAVGGPLTKLIEDMAAQFTKENPDIVVKPVFSGNYADTLTKVQTLIQGGQTPDVAVLLSTDVYTLVDSDAIIPLTDLINADPDGTSYIADFFPAFMANSRIGDTVYGIPFQRSMIVMYYNKELLSQAGFSEPPRNWDELVAAGKAITKPDAGIWGIKIPSDGYPYWMAQVFAIQSGRNLMNDDGTEVYFNSPENLQGVSFMRDLIFTHKVMPEGVISWASTPTDFISGKVGMIYHSSGSLTNITNSANFPFGVAFLPAGPKGYGAPTGGGNFYIFKGIGEAKQQAAWKLIRFMTEPERLAQWSLDTGYVAPRQASWDTQLMKDAVAKDPNYGVARDQLQYARAELSVHNNPQVYKIYNDQIQAIVNGQKGVPEALEEAQRQAEAVLAPFGR